MIRAKVRLPVCFVSLSVCDSFDDDNRERERGGGELAHDGREDSLIRI